MSSTEGISADARTKIEILMKEYDTLRAEILARTNNRFNILGLMFAVVAAIGSFKGLSGGADWSLLGLWLLFMGVVWWALGRLIIGCHHRLVVIERRVNELAGEPLLQWETGWSKAK